MEKGRTEIKCLVLQMRHRRDFEVVLKMNGEYFHIFWLGSGVTIAKVGEEDVKDYLQLLCMEGKLEKAYGIGVEE